MKNKSVNNQKGPEYIETVGRRREATARVRLYPLSNKSEITVNSIVMKKGEVYINDHPAAEYYPGSLMEKIYTSPLRAANVSDVVIRVQLAGGGKTGQLGALIHGMSRALDAFNKELHDGLKKHGFLTRDPRIKERRKVGQAGRARAKKSSPKR
jgi:small subunit ribosomal protein S9